MPAMPLEGRGSGSFSDRKGSFQRKAFYSQGIKCNHMIQLRLMNQKVIFLLLLVGKRGGGSTLDNHTLVEEQRGTNCGCSAAGSHTREAIWLRRNVVRRCQGVPIGQPCPCQLRADSSLEKC